MQYDSTFYMRWFYILLFHLLIEFADNKDWVCACACKWARWMKWGERVRERMCERYRIPSQSNRFIHFMNTNCNQCSQRKRINSGNKSMNINTIAVWNLVGEIMELQTRQISVANSITARKIPKYYKMCAFVCIGLCVEWCEEWMVRTNDEQSVC